MMGWVQWCGLMIMVPVWAGADLDIDLMVKMFFWRGVADRIQQSFIRTIRVKICKYLIKLALLNVGSLIKVEAQLATQNPSHSSHSSDVSGQGTPVTALTVQLFLDRAPQSQLSHIRYHWEGHPSQSSQLKYYYVRKAH